MRIRLRPVTSADEVLLLSIYASTRADELAMTGWDPQTCEQFVRLQFEAQRNHYARQWPDASHSIVCAEVDGDRHEVGRLWLDRRADLVQVLDIALLAHWRGRGVGSSCLREVMNEAALSGKRLSICVELGNPARRLYERLGFLADGQAEGLHQRMSWRAAPIRSEETCNEQA